MSIDRVIYFAGWADKINQVFGSVNPVATSHFNFSLLEPMGVVGLVAPEKSGLLGLVSSLCPILVSGNCGVVLASEKLPLCSITLAEVLATSDVPAGVVNILTGKKDEIMAHLAKHMDVNAIYLTDNLKYKKSVQEEATQNLKRVVLGNQKSWMIHQLKILTLSLILWKQKQHGILLRSFLKLGQDINFKNMEGSKKRHIAKTLTWRITATLTTMIIAWVVSGDPMTGLTVGGIEFFIKMPVYYLHERAWYKSNFGIDGRNK